MTQQIIQRSGRAGEPVNRSRSVPLLTRHLVLPTAPTAATYLRKFEAVLPGRNDKEMGPANTIHALA